MHLHEHCHATDVHESRHHRRSVFPYASVPVTEDRVGPETESRVGRGTEDQVGPESRVGPETEALGVASRKSRINIV